MDQLVENKGIVKQKVEGAINIGCRMLSRSKKVRKKLNSDTGMKTSLKKSIDEMDSMTMELIDKLFEINARIDRPVKRIFKAGTYYRRFIYNLNRALRKSRKMIDNMRLTYQDVFTL